MSLSLYAASGWWMELSVKSVELAPGVGNHASGLVPFGVYKSTMRLGGVAEAASARRESKRGRARAPSEARRKWRRVGRLSIMVRPPLDVGCAVGKMGSW